MCLLLKMGVAVSGYASRLVVVGGSKVWKLFPLSREKKAMTRGLGDVDNPSWRGLTSGGAGGR